VEPAPRLAAAIGLAADALWIKRDDLTGLGGGGNKLRKLRYTGAQALAAGATALITTGAPQSNHARLTAAVAARLGLGCVLVLEGEQPGVLQGNLALDRLAGAELAWAAGPAPDRVRHEVERQARRVRDGGGVPYVIPFGGSSSFAALGYVDCGTELLAQVPGLDHVVVAFGSGGTMAGLVACLGADRVVGVDTGAVPDPRATLDELLDGMPGRHTPQDRLQIDGGQVGAGYATLARVPPRRCGWPPAPRASSSTPPTRRGRWPGWALSSPTGGSSRGTAPFSCTPAGCLGCSVIPGSRT